MAVADGHQQPGLHDVAGLFRERHAELVRLAALVVGDRPTAEDVVQDVFARLCARDLLPDREHSLAYARAAVLNGCRSVLRRRALVRRIGGARDLDRSDHAPDSAEDEVILAEDRRQVLAALASLPVRRREVLVLRYWLGLSEAEIASMMAISKGTVKSNAARGLAALARVLGRSHDQDRGKAGRRARRRGAVAARGHAAPAPGPAALAAPRGLDCAGRRRGEPAPRRRHRGGRGRVPARVGTPQRRDPAAPLLRRGGRSRRSSRRPDDRDGSGDRHGPGPAPPQPAGTVPGDRRRQRAVLHRRAGGDRGTDLPVPADGHRPGQQPQGPARRGAPWQPAGSAGRCGLARRIAGRGRADAQQRCLCRWLQRLGGCRVAESSGQDDQIDVVNTASGLTSVWQGGIAQNYMFSVTSLSWTGNGNELVYYGEWCPQGGSSTQSTTTLSACQPGAGTSGARAEVWALNPVSNGGPLNGGHRLFSVSGEFSYLPQVLISPDGTTLTALALTGPANGAGTSQDLAVEQISLATRRRSGVLYSQNLGRAAVVHGKPAYLYSVTLSADAAGQHWMLSSGYCNTDDLCQGGFNGWIDSGRLVPLPPVPGSVASEAW